MLQLASGNVSMLVATSGPPDMTRPGKGKLNEMGWVGLRAHIDLEGVKI